MLIEEYKLNHQIRELVKYRIMPLLHKLGVKITICNIVHVMACMGGPDICLDTWDDVDELIDTIQAAIWEKEQEVKAASANNGNLTVSNDS